MEILTFILFSLLIIISSQYNYIILSAFALGVFFIFSASWSNLFLLLIYFLCFYFFNLDFSFGFISSFILLIILILVNIFKKKKIKDDSSDDGFDFSKLFGGA
ncbi:MAG: hypothetical protein PHR26_02980 [Candidatus ainarchaeum sp.]|nr:hypothetical protein [Candidatus ainarchaeum sp.]MDD3975565.1 hypothetical protein [Candidatus ainarchaeum sp.]